MFSRKQHTLCSQYNRLLSSSRRKSAFLSNIMGTIFGKYEEPKFDVVYSSRMIEENNIPNTIPYEIRKYGKRFAVEAEYIGGTSSPFPLLAGYIGVMQRPQNEGNKSISMTTPVSMAGEGTTTDDKGGMKIKMTTPVTMHGEGSDPAASVITTTTKRKKMQFMLPAEFDDISKIPKPSNPHVHIVQLQEAVGAVHRYTGTLNRTKSKEMASKLIKQLQEDGVDNMDQNVAMLENFQYWRYDPPMTLPWFSRNEVWIELTQDQVNKLLTLSSEKFSR